MAWQEDTFDVMEVLTASHDKPVDLVVLPYDWYRFVNRHAGYDEEGERETAEEVLAWLGIEGELGGEKLSKLKQAELELMEMAAKNGLKIVQVHTSVAHEVMEKWRVDDGDAYEERFAGRALPVMEGAIDHAIEMRMNWRERKRDEPEPIGEAPVGVVFDSWHVMNDVYLYRVQEMLEDDRRSKAERVTEVQGFLHQESLKLYDRAVDENEQGRRVSIVGRLHISNSPASPGLFKKPGVIGEALRHGLVGLFQEKGVVMNNLLLVREAEKRTPGRSKKVTLEVNPLYPIANPIYRVVQLFTLYFTFEFSPE